MGARPGSAGIVVVIIDLSNGVGARLRSKRGSIRDINATRLDGAVQDSDPEPREISDLLETIGFEGPVTISPLGLDEFPQLIAEIQTPSGVRELT
jgi:hypothetical protein